MKRLKGTGTQLEKAKPALESGFMTRVGGWTCFVWFQRAEVKPQ